MQNSAAIVQYCSSQTALKTLIYRGQYQQSLLSEMGIIMPTSGNVAMWRSACIGCCKVEATGGSRIVPVCLLALATVCSLRAFKLPIHVRRGQAPSSQPPCSRQQKLERASKPSVLHHTRYMKVSLMDHSVRFVCHTLRICQCWNRLTPCLPAADLQLTCEP